MENLVSPSIQALRPYQAGKAIEELARERGISDIVKLASNESPQGPSPKALQAAQRALSEVHRYPDGAGFRLRDAIAKFLNIGVDEVVHGNGSNEIIELIIRTFCTPEHHVVFGRPSFSMYPVVVAAHNCPGTAVPTNGDLVHDLDAMVAAVQPNTRVLLLDNPNNPTGSYVPRPALEKFLREVPPWVIVVLDEAYFEYAENDDYPNGLELRHLRERLIILRTFSKAYGMAALRVGFGVGPAELINYIHRLRAPFNVGGPSQEAAIAALEDQEHLRGAVAQNQQERARLFQALLPLARRVYPSQTNFVLADMGRDAEALYDALLDEGVIVRPLPGLPTFLRISVGTSQETTRAIEALQKVLA
ncbi:MAG: histidinol-phosphate transaminase [Polyangiaceae bacterium]|nr:histidinol-phosphate transaminase [Polyangiaceae bacterium]